MHRIALRLLAASALAAAACLPAQDYQTQQQAAPIERQAPTLNTPASNNATAQPQLLTSQPAQGISVRSTMALRTVASGPATVELRLDRGIADVTVHKPREGTLIQIDLPAGQTVLLRDGLYTFNADTSTVRVLKGEAQAYPGSSPAADGIPLKEGRQLTFGPDNPTPQDLDLSATRTDLLPNPNAADHGDSRPYGYYPYGYGFAPYPYPYYAGWGWAPPYSPWGWRPAYPYAGIGLGWYGGFGRPFYGHRGFGRW